MFAARGERSERQLIRTSRIPTIGRGFMRRASICIECLYACLIFAQVGLAQKPLTTVSLGGEHGSAFALNPRTNKIYVVGGLGNSLTEIDGRSFAATRIPLEDTGKEVASAHVAIDANTNKIFVINVVSKNVAIVDGLTHAVRYLPTAVGPYALAVNAITNKVYVADFGGNAVTIFDERRNTVKNVAVGLAP